MKKINKLDSKIQKVKNCALVTTSAITMSLIRANMIFADAAEVMEEIFNIIGKILVGAGVALGLFGAISWAYANSEGDGPGKHKAVGMIVAAAMLLLLSAILLGGSASKLASFITA